MSLPFTRTLDPPRPRIGDRGDFVGALPLPVLPIFVGVGGPCQEVSKKLLPLPRFVRAEREGHEREGQVWQSLIP